MCNECEDNHGKEDETNKKIVEVAVTDGGYRVNSCSDLCVPWKMEVFSYCQRVINQQWKNELVLVARQDKG